MNYRVIDFHAHAFHPKIEKNAIKQLERHYSLKISQRGQISHLIESASMANVDKIVVHTTATHPGQVENVNTWIASITNEKVIGFGTLHPEYPFWEKELQRMKQLGLKGLKLHPDFQGFDIDDPRMWPIYRALDRRFPILFHLGDETLNHSSPRKLARVLEQFPNLRVIGAHMGGYARWDEAREYLVGKDLYLDTSSTLWRLNPDEVVGLIRSHGVDKVLFGSDYPIASHQEELERFFKLPLSPEEMEKVLWKNGEELLKTLDIQQL